MWCWIHLYCLDPFFLTYYNSSCLVYRRIFSFFNWFWILITIRICSFSFISPGIYNLFILQISSVSFGVTWFITLCVSLFAEVKRRKWMEDNPQSSSNEDPVVFDTSIIPWWAWMKRFHLPEAELLNGLYISFSLPCCGNYCTER